MRAILTGEITEVVAKMCVEAACVLPEDVVHAIEAARGVEESDVGKEILDRLLENVELARAETRPICQDTGVAVFFVEKGAEVSISGGSLREAIDEGVRRGYTDGYLRKSIVRHPLDRVNTKDNTPAIIHMEEVPGDKLTIYMMAKGAGCENMSRLKMLTPSQGVAGVKDFVVETVEKGWANPCPPVVVGVGIGGNFEKAALLSKKALLGKLGEPNPDPLLDELEIELLERINNLGIGPQGLGGRVTALGVKILAHPCHIASLPVAVNMECHAHRHAKVVL